jgi:hypothetical protein
VQPSFAEQLSGLRDHIDSVRSQLSSIPKAEQNHIKVAED